HARPPGERRRHRVQPRGPHGADCGQRPLAAGRRRRGALGRQGPRRQDRRRRSLHRHRASARRASDPNPRGAAMRLRHTLVWAAFALPLAGVAHAATATQVPVGPRAVALGGAFTALSDDASALFWNPAGLVFVGHQELSASHADLFGTDIRDNFAAFVLPLSPGLAAAADWYHSGFEDDQLGFRENRVDAGFGMEIRSRLAVGVNTKLLTPS